MVDKALFTSTHGEWETPKKLFKLLDDEFRFELDPCCTGENALCSFFYTKDEDGLSLPWHGLRVFVNPPYGRGIGLWTSKCVAEAEKGATVVALLPARTDTTYWHKDIMRAEALRFIEGRLKFTLHGITMESAPFPSVVVIWQQSHSPWGPVVSTLHIPSSTKAKAQGC